MSEQYLTIRELSAQLVELKRSAGWTPQKTKAWLNEHVPEDNATDKRLWVKCTACCDSGVITCLSKITKRGDGQLVFSTAAAACHCYPGQAFSKRENHPLPEYDDCEHVSVKPWWNIEQVFDELRKTRERAIQRKREPTFDDFNKRNSNSDF